MKHKQSFWCLWGIIALTFLSGYLNAQVTLGSSLPPASGALLDMKEFQIDNRADNSLRGLMMPRVPLEKRDNLAPCVRDLDPASPENQKHVGLILFNTATVFQEGLCPGIYVWNSEVWNRLNGTCDGFTVSEVKDTYVMDGQEYYFKLNSFDSWTAEIDTDPSNIIHSILATSGNAATNFDFKFKMNIKTDATGSATIKLKSPKGQEQLVTINGEIPVIDITPNISAGVDQAYYAYTYTSNSTLPTSLTSNDNWLTMENGKIRVADNTTGAIKTGSVTASNGAAISKKITITQEALTLSLSTASMTAHVDGQNMGYTYSSNSNRAPSISSTAPGWLSADAGTVYTAMTNSGTTRSANINVAIGEVSRPITVTQEGITLSLTQSDVTAHVDGQSIGYSYTSNSNRVPSVSSSDPSWLSGNTYSVTADMTYAAAGRAATVYASIGEVSRGIIVRQDAFQFGVTNTATVNFMYVGGNHNPGFVTNTANYAARGINITAPNWITANAGGIATGTNGAAYRTGTVTYSCNNRGSINVTVCQFAHIGLYYMKGQYGLMDGGMGGDGVLMPAKQDVNFTIQLDIDNTGYEVEVEHISSQIGASGNFYAKCTISGNTATVFVPAGMTQVKITFKFKDPSLFGRKYVYNLRRKTF